MARRADQRSDGIVDGFRERSDDRTEIGLERIDDFLDDVHGGGVGECTEV